MIWLTSEFLCSFRAPGDREVIIDKKDVKVREQLGKDIGTNRDASFYERSGDCVCLEHP
jgi:hypothetical protein